MHFLKKVLIRNTKEPVNEKGASDGMEMTAWMNVQDVIAESVNDFQIVIR